MAWLFPREHGAYGQLAFPLIAALGLATPEPAAVLLVVAFVAAFIAHEPLLVLLGQRGPRARRELQDDAVKTLVWTGATAIADAAIAMVFMPAAVRWTVFVPGAFALAAIPMIVQKRQKTAIGEMHVALTLASCALPVGAATGASPQAAAACWFIFTLGFWAATLAVRGTIALQRRERALWLRIGAAAIAVASPFIVMAFSRRFTLSPLLWVSTLPLGIAAVVLALLPPSARRLRAVGWLLVAGGAMAAIAVIAISRA